MPRRPRDDDRPAEEPRDLLSIRSGSGAPGREQALQAALHQLVPSWHQDYADRPDALVTAVRRMPPAEARLEPFPDGLDARLRSALGCRGICQLYTHQAEAVRHSLAGQHVVVTTPTASGKTLCYNVPVLNAILTEPSTRALYLFPTKALAQDQLAELDRLAQVINESAGLDLGVFTYDGDTPQDARRAIRTRAQVILTNPDMLHSGILPHHPKWARLFENLRFIVIDELHAYRGVFGSHLANVLRRLRRICRHYGSDPQFVCSSATIANPRELAERLTERPFQVVDESGAPRGEKYFFFVNPPIVNRQLGIRRSYTQETRRVALEFLRRRLQVIVFAQSRLVTEILTRYLKESVPGPPGAEDVVRGYRGGYLPNRRREIEKGLRDGEVRAVVATSALELGIDIGALDVAVLAGYPGTIAATWQRAGRAGRRAGTSAAVLVGSSAPLDQYILRNPSYFFDASPEHALINPDNLQILLAHIKCAAFELPFGVKERYGRENVQDILQILSEEGLVHLAEGQAPGEEAHWHWTNESYPADAISLRSVSSDNFVVVDNTDHTRVIGETDYTSAPSTLHEKAIYIVEGTLYQVERLDFDNRKAYVRKVDCDYYTDAIRYDRVTILDCFETSATDPGGDPSTPPDSTALGAGEPSQPLRDPLATGHWPLATDALPAIWSHGEVHVVSRVVGFKKIKFYTNENVGSGELDLPEQEMHTTGCWFTIPRALMTSLPFGGDDRRDGVLGLSFAMRQVAQLLLMCDRHDIGVSIGNGNAVEVARGSALSGTNAAGGPSQAPVDYDEPRIFVYDNYPGGIGLSEPLFSMRAGLVARTRGLIAGCPCESGCPSCVGPLGEVGPLAKTVALEILGRV
ncbi:MAG: DEAD/DEAH box helicase [Acidobacteria bacterium]|nr:MAG: DEAD/DEAH box helicase [Acidobacteriota bacterium]